MQDNNSISENEKPDCPLIGQDGNIFNLIGIATRTLRQCDMMDQSIEMARRINACGSYEEALSIIGEYVNFTSIHDEPTQKKSICNRLREIKTMNPSVTSKKSKKEQEL